MFAQSLTIVSPSNHKYDIQDYDYIDPHFAVIKKDEGELLKEDEKENKKASRYICRVTSKENLDASNEYFAELVKEIHARGMKVILDGVFMKAKKDMSRVHMYLSQAHITTFLVLPEACGHIIRIMKAGGDMIHCQSLTMRAQRNYMTIFFV